MAILFPSICAAFSAETVNQELCFREQRPIILTGVNVREPRDVLFQGDDGIGHVLYWCSNHAPQQWTPQVAQIRTVLEGFNFRMWSSHLADMPHINGALINRYCHGKDSMGFHDDKYLAMGRHPLILSVSLGATRKFQLRHCKEQEGHSFLLEHGSVLLMYGRKLQKCWKHGVPKDNKVTCSSQFRLNLSFRHHLQESAIDTQNKTKKRSKHL